MGTPRAWSEEECRNEAAFIKRVNPEDPGKTFLYNKDSFLAYCRMQANAIGERSGYRAIAREVLKHAGISA